MQRDNERGKNIKPSYKKLWKILINRDMTKTDLLLRAGIGSSPLAKLGKGESVTTAVLWKSVRCWIATSRKLCRSKAANNVTEEDAGEA